MTVKLGNEEEKREVMRREEGRKRFLTEGVYIDDDMMKREREVQQRLR